MKFLCENCKAKYQIADDKVAGRTVRMKCRKCNHMIEVEASVTETSVAATSPDEDKAKSASTGVSATKGAVQAAAAGIAPRPAPPPPRPMSPSLSGVKPKTPLPGAAPSSSRPPGAKPAPKTPPAVGGAGLAGAFSKAVSAPQEDPSSVSAAMAVLSSSGSATEEWYVGINGVPVGPVRLSDLRRKASNGLITEESLVWREGFEEWVPLRTFPELVALLKESAAAGRASLTPTPSAAAPAPPNRVHSPLPRGPGLPAGSGVRPSVTPRAVPSQPRSNVLAFAARGGAAEKLDGLDPVEEQIKLDESVRPPPAAPGVPPSQPETAPLVAAAVPAALPEVFEPQPIQFRSAALSQRPQSRRVHPAFYVVVALGGVLLGVVAMVVLMPKSNVKPAVQIVSVMVPAPAAPEKAPEKDEGTTIGPIEVSAPVVAAASTKGSGSKKAAAAAAEPASPGTPAAPLSTSLTGLGGLVGGPSAPSGGSTSGSSGGQLQTVDLERVVQSHRAFVKRQCWDPALGARAPGAPSSARVVVAINVGRDGSVQSANATGGDGYPGLSSCVQGQVKNWKFPQGDGTTSFTVPFVFAAQ